MTEQGVGVVRPLPGDGLIAHMGGLLLVCDAADAVAEELVTALRDTAAAGGDGRALARRVAQVLARAMTAEPVACAVAGRAGGGIAVLVSGDAQASITGPGTDVRLDGKDALTWTDRLVTTQVSTVELRLPGAGRPIRQARLDAGVVPGGGLVSDLAEADGGLPAPRPEPSSRPAAHDPLPAAEPARPEPAPAAFGVEAPPPISSPPAVSAPPPPADVPGPLREYEQPSVPAGPEPARQAPGGGHTGAQEFDPFPPAGPPAGEPDHASGPLLEPTEMGPTPEPPSRPMVYGVDCQNDHFNDPRVPYCAVCGVALVQRNLVPYKGERPSLGVLALDDGMTLALDADHLLGRDPERAPEVTSGEARPARVTSPDGSVSRRHLRVRLDGWDVNLVDLGSVNGTQVQPPGDPNFYDIPPNEPVPILPGTTVRIGVSRTMRYDGHRQG
ncbi:hypothetical protein Ssi03_00140 [Sphaerisporangium siamense]|uniref:FHA domain-containing protein n=1 Tax=Sphaerisporangium siamense TaxID=795645 RepID=A0A7W7GA50_9ACTN|nr:FHA domain-containing protein [Sphaerisporangium siamense]MBB4703553.1 hypothetical protein [Sphaerisporangium siamense]GII82024.1 hypothetical protein Ssi03_00140 [Sphaerisporangium siamense]